MSDGARSGIGPGKLVVTRGAVTNAAYLTALAACLSTAAASLSTGIALAATSGGRTGVTASLTTVPAVYQGKTTQIGPGKLVATKGAAGANTASLSAISSSRGNVVPTLSTGISLIAIAGARADVLANLTAYPIQYRGKPTQIGPGKLVVVRGASIGPQANLSAACGARSTVVASITTGVLSVGQPGPMFGPSLATPYNPNQFPEAATPHRQGAVLNAISGSRTAITASLTTGIPLVANAFGLSTVTVSFSTIDALSLAAYGLSSVNASLTTGIALTSPAAAQSTVQAALSTGIPLAANLYGVSSVTVAVGGGAVLSSQAFVSSYVSANLSTGIALSAQLYGLSSVSADLLELRGLSAGAFGNAIVTATLSLGAGLQAVAAGNAGVSANLTTGIQLTAVLCGNSTVIARTTVTFYRGELIPLPLDDRRIIPTKEGF